MLKAPLLTVLLSIATLLQGSSPKKENCVPDERHMRAAVRHIEAGGIGYNKGYSTLEAFIASDPNQWYAMPFLDLRGHVFNDGKFAANAGAGVRTLWNSDFVGCRAYGMNVYYDYRHTHHKGYHQVGLGLETLGEFWDLRINGYLPVGGKISDPYKTEFGGFSGHSILVDRRFQYAMKGLDGEVGFHFGKTSDFDFYAATGPYYFKGKRGSAAVGGKARVAAFYKEYVTLELSDSWDNVFKNNVQGQVTFTFPFGPKSRPKATKEGCPNSCESAKTLTTRMLGPVARQEIIVVDAHTKTDPTSDFVIFVDNENGSNGTIEDPYASLTDAELNSKPGDIIYVFPGNGTTNNYDLGITLQNRQKFWGSGVSHRLATNFGTIAIPPQTNTSPQMTNTGGDGITLANGNNVSGFIITRAQGNGVAGADVTNAAFSELTIFGSVGNGINLTETVNATLVFDRLFVTNNATDGMDIAASSAANVNVSITNSTFSLNGNISNGRGIVLDASGTATFHATLNDNTLAGNLLAAIEFDSTSASTSPLVFNLKGNRIEGNADRAIAGSFTGSAPIDVTLTNNQIVGNVGGLGVSFFDFAGAGASTFTATGNAFNKNTNPGALYIQAGANGDFTGTIQNNLMSDNCNQGVMFICNGAHPINITFENNAIFGNCADGMDLFAGGSNAQLTFIANNNSWAGNCDTGVFINQSFDSITALFTNNNFEGNCGHGISFNGSATNLTTEFTGNTFIGNCGQGINIINSVGNDFVFVASNNQISGQCGNGVLITSNPTSAVASTITITGNAITDNFANGVEIDASPTSTHTVFVDLNNNAINHQTNSDGYGVLFNYGGSSTGTSTFLSTNNTITANDNDGIQINVTNSGAGILDLTVANTVASFNRGNGINVIGNPSGAGFMLNGAFTSNTVTNNDLSGLTFLSENNATSVLFAEGNTFANNNPFLTAPNYAGLQASNTSSSSSLCATLAGNASDTGYLLTQTAGTFNVPQTLAEVEAENTGPVNTSGTINFNTPCP